MQTIIIRSKLDFLFLPNMLAPVELLPTRENLAALKVLAFLSSRLNPAAINLLVLPPTICRASPKNHSMVSVFIDRGLILSPFITL
jgi:hypothetical protein